jgi:hypothetical protein
MPVGEAEPTPRPERVGQLLAATGLVLGGGGLLGLLLDPKLLGLKLGGARLLATLHDFRARLNGGAAEKKCDLCHVSRPRWF